MDCEGEVGFEFLDYWLYPLLMDQDWQERTHIFWNLLWMQFRIMRVRPLEHEIAELLSQEKIEFQPLQP